MKTLLRARGSSLLFVVAFIRIMSIPVDSARAEALDNWTPVSINATNFWLDGVTYANGRYVAVGGYGDWGALETSEDGLHWVLRNYGPWLGGTPWELHKVVCGNGTFVAVGWDFYTGQNLYHSTNGINWTSHTNATVSNFYGVAYNNGLFVAVGDGSIPNGFGATNGQIYSSPDGITWTQRSSGSPANDVRYLWDVAAGGGRFIAVDGEGNIYRRQVSGNFSRTAVTNAGRSVSFVNNLFYVSAGIGTNLISADGVTWTSVTNNSGRRLDRIVYANGIYLALSGGTNILSSTDATNWNLRFQVPGGVSLNDISVGNDRVIVVGSVLSPPYQSSAAYVSDSFAGLAINRGFPPQIKVSGLLGKSYRIEGLSDLLTTNWQSLGTFVLTNSPQTWTDPSPTNSFRVYRTVLLP